MDGSSRNGSHDEQTLNLWRARIHRISEVVIIRTAVGIAQLAEHRTVAPTVAGSIPVSHPKTSRPAALPPIRISEKKVL
jgi:hypothetical protein